MFHWCRCGSALFVLTQVLDACFFGRGGEGGGEVLKNVLYREALPWRPTPYLLYTTENRIKSQWKIKLSQKKKKKLLHDVYKFTALEIFVTSSLNMAGNYFSWLLYFALQYTDRYVRRHGHWSLSFVFPTRGANSSKCSPCSFRSH